MNSIFIDDEIFVSFVLGELNYRILKSVFEETAIIMKQTWYISKANKWDSIPETCKQQNGSNFYSISD